MQSLVFLLVFGMCLLTLPMSAFAEDLKQPQQIEVLARQVIKDAFPELSSQTIKFQAFMSADSFFQSNFEIPSLFSPAPIYRVEYNPRLIGLNCPVTAVEAILAHELSHTLDYVEGGLPGILNIVAQLRWDPSNQVYEHRTDLRAIFRGYGEGLIAYRRWIYSQINAQELKHKQATYYQPEEIRLVMAVIEQAKRHQKQQALENYWLTDVPMNATEIKHALTVFELH